MGYTALAAIEAVKAQPPDLALMNIKLGGELDGIAAAGLIQPIANVPIVYLSGHSQDPLLQQAKATAPYGYLVKPVAKRELAATTEMALSRHTLDRRLQESEGKRRLAMEATSGVKAGQVMGRQLFELFPSCKLGAGGKVNPHGERP